MVGQFGLSAAAKIVFYSKSFRTCHPERRASPAKRDKRKSKDPEDVSSVDVSFREFSPCILHIRGFLVI